MKKQEKTKIRLIEMNNKSRKGLYVYIKEPDKKPSYYKYDEDISIDYYKQYYENKNKIRNIKKYKNEIRKALYGTKKPKPIQKTTQKKKPEDYIQEIKKKPSITKTIKKGITTAKIANAEKLSNTKIIKLKKDLLRELVTDKKLLEEIVTQENFKKIKTRLEYRLIFREQETDRPIANTNIFNKTPEEITNIINKLKANGETIDINKQYASIETRAKNLGFQNFEKQRSGTIGRTELQVIFRKAK